MTQHPSAPRTGHRARPKARLAAATAAVAAVAALLSGCGIRDTALPVDAGQGASRTACPPAPDVSLSQLDHDAYASPAADWRSGPAKAHAAASAAPTPSGTLSCLQPSTTPTEVAPSAAPTAAPAGSPSP